MASRAEIAVIFALKVTRPRYFCLYLKKLLLGIFLKTMRIPVSIILLFVTGCGYQFQGSGSILPTDVKTVAISQAENQTTEPGLALRFSEALRSRFERYGAVQVSSDEGNADAVLKTTIKDVGSRVRNTNGVSDQEVDQELVLTISGELKKRSGQILWKIDGLKVYQSFAGVSGVIVTRSAGFAGSDFSASQLGNLTNNNRELSRGQKQVALNAALDEAARQIYNDAVAEDF